MIERGTALSARSEIRRRILVRRPTGAFASWRAAERITISEQPGHPLVQVYGAPSRSSSSNTATSSRLMARSPAMDHELDGNPGYHRGRGGKNRNHENIALIARHPACPVGEQLLFRRDHLRDVRTDPV